MLLSAILIIIIITIIIITTDDISVKTGLAYVLDHASLGSHDLDPVRVVGELVGRVGEQSVHDGGIHHEVRPETHRQRLHLQRTAAVYMTRIYAYRSTRGRPN